MRSNGFSKKVALTALASLALATTGMAAAPVDLGSASNFSILAKTGISTTGTTHIIGNIGASPVAATGITGFGLIADPSNQFSTSSLVDGGVYAADYAPPTPSIMTTSIGDMQAAYTDAAGRAPDVIDPGAGAIGGLTFVAGVYKFTTPVTIATDIYLTGSSTAVWIFEIPGTLIVSSAAQVHLSGGAKSENIFWQVAGTTTLGTTSVFYGNILDQTNIALNTGAVLYGKALAQTAVTLQANVVTSSTTGYLGANPPDQGASFAFPSPANGDTVSIVYQMKSAGMANLRIWNENGDLAASLEEHRLGGPQKSIIPITSFAPGVYLFRMVLTYDSGEVQRLDVQKFAVQK